MALPPKSSEPPSDPDFPPTLVPNESPPTFFIPDTFLPERDYPLPLRPPNTSEIVPGYELIEELGRGGMGVVFKARQVGLNRVVALKMILAGAHSSAEDRQRLRQEAEAIARLQHPNIIQVYEVSEHQGQAYFSLEFCGGGSLADALTSTPLPEKQAARLLVPLARAIQHAHEHGIIHRDLKPGNVLLTLPSDQEEGLAEGKLLQVAIPKITDFGLAKRLDADSRTRDGDVMGTPSYMAPEQAAGKIAMIGPHSDTYALGAILYELLTGRPPFLTASPMETVFQVITRDPVPIRALQPHVSRDLETISLKCLQKEPARRYGSARELGDDLERYLDGQPILARPVGVIERGWRWVRRHPALAALGGVLLVAVLSFIGGWVWFTNQLSIEKQYASEKAIEADQAREIAEIKRHEAETNRDLAESRFRKALEVANRYFTEVSESTLLHEPGMQPLRQKLLSKARDFYLSFVQERRDDPNLAVELAKSIYRLGVIDSELGDLDGAIAKLDTARKRFDRLLQLDVEDESLAETRARLLNDLGRLERLRGRPIESMRVYRLALEAWENLYDRSKDSQDAMEGLGRCLLGIGNVEMMLDHRKEALASYQRSLEIRQRLTTLDPGNEERQRDLAMTWQNLASVYVRLGQVTESEQAQAQALSTFRKLVAAMPSRGRFREDLAVACYNEGHRLMQAKAFSPAGERFAEAIHGFEYLVFTHPGVPNYLNRLGHALWNLALCMEKLQRTEAAENAYTKARLVRQQLAIAQPGVPEYQVAYAQCLRREGDRALDRKDFKAARQSYLQARQVLEKAPVSPDGRYLFAVVLHKSAMLAESDDEASGLFEQSLNQVRSLIQQQQLVQKASRLEKFVLEDRAKRLKDQVRP